jgi:hypothetical protein
LELFEHVFEYVPVGDDLDPHPPPEPRQKPSRQEGARTVQTYQDLVEVRKGPVAGYGADGAGSFDDDLRADLRLEALPDDGPQQFLWRGRLWQVREIVAHWAEAGAWWLRRPEDTPGRSALVTQRLVWRVTAARGRAVATADDPGFGIFDLTFDGAEGVWRLAGSLD